MSALAMPLHRHARTCSGHLLRRLVGGWALHYARTTLWACATWMAGTSPAMT